MKASVLIKTFNHERFVETTLASVLMQRTGFEWEIVVSDDASTDGTAAALRRIAATNPTRLRVIERSTNLGPVRNFIETLGACRGEYVALLDGDDYWTARDKLASQVAWLDERREYGASTHDAVRVDALGRETGDRYCSSKLPERLTLERILRGNPVPACALVFRRAIVEHLPAWFEDVPFTDWPLHVLLAQQGPLHYRREPLAAHRVHGEGLWSGMREESRLRASLALHRSFEEHAGAEYGSLIRARTARLRLQLATVLDRAGDTAASRREARLAMREAGVTLPRLLFSRSFRSLLPGLARRRPGATGL